jgi:hypothetical protein
MAAFNKPFRTPITKFRFQDVVVLLLKYARCTLYVNTGLRYVQNIHNAPIKVDSKAVLSYILPNSCDRMVHAITRKRRRGVTKQWYLAT